MSRSLAIGILVLGLGMASCSTGSDTNMYRVDVSVEPFEAGTISPAADSTYEEGSKINLQAQAASKYRFTEWTGDAEGDQNLLQLTVDKNYTLTAQFEPDPTQKMEMAEVARLIGPESINRTQSSWNVKGTDLGHMFMHEGDIYMVFGDTDVGNHLHGSAMAVIKDDDPWDGLTFDQMITDPARPGNAKELLSEDGIPNQQKSVIPTYGVSVDGRMYLHYMAIKEWGPAGEWQLNRSGISYSDDGGINWKYSDVIWGGSSNFGQVAFVKKDNYVYLFGIPGGRFGDLKLARVEKQHLLDQDRYRYWNGSQWVSDQQSAAVVLKGPVGELSVRWNSYYKKWILMTKRQERNADGYGIVVFTADKIAGPWSNERMIITDEEVPRLYAPYMPPKWNDGPNIFFTLSKFRPIYDVFWWHTSLADPLSD